MKRFRKLFSRTFAPRVCPRVSVGELMQAVLQAVMQFCFSELSYAPAALCVHGTVPCTHYWFSLVTAYRVYRALLHVTAILRIIVFENTGQVRFPVTSRSAIQSGIYIRTMDRCLLFLSPKSVNNGGYCFKCPNLPLEYNSFFSERVSFIFWISNALNIAEFRFVSTSKSISYQNSYRERMGYNAVHFSLKIRGYKIRRWGKEGGSKNIWERIGIRATLEFLGEFPSPRINRRVGKVD